MPRYHTDCRYFTGYRPCRFRRPCDGCPEHDPVTTEVLLVNLDALGDVLRTTALVPAIRRAFPGCRLTWLTRPRAVALLADHPGIDRVLPLTPESVWELEARSFDVLLQCDKSRTAGGVAARIDAADRRGFGLDERGNIVPSREDAQTLYALGLDDDRKFRGNPHPETRLLCEALGLPWQRDPYTLVLPDGPAGPPRKVGFNTGCSPDYPYKKLPLDTQAAAIARLSADLGEPVLLLGGPEDAVRNAALAERLGPRVESTPVDRGLRAGAAQVARCDVVVSGDSLGMHMAIALGKHVVAWFGVTCPQEIDLYDRGVRILAEVGCAPCWKSRCDLEPKCFDRVEADAIVQAVHDCLDARAADRPLDAYRGAGWYRPPGG